MAKYIPIRKAVAEFVLKQISNSKISGIPFSVQHIINQAEETFGASPNLTNDIIQRRAAEGMIKIKGDEASCHQ